MGINAVKGVEIGAGFAAVAQRGTEHSDEMTPQGFLSQHAGGILGGISTGQDIVVSIAVKPTSSIRLDRHSIDKAGQPGDRQHARPPRSVRRHSRHADRRSDDGARADGPRAAPSRAERRRRHVDAAHRGAGAGRESRPRHARRARSTIRIPTKPDAGRRRVTACAGRVDRFASRARRVAKRQRDARRRRVDLSRRRTTIAAVGVGDDRVAALEHRLRIEVREVLRRAPHARRARARAASRPRARQRVAQRARAARGCGSGARSSRRRAAVRRAATCAARVSMPARAQRARRSAELARRARAAARAAPRDGRGGARLVEALRARRRARARSARASARAIARDAVRERRAVGHDERRRARWASGARTSATKSQIVKSVSWPTPDTTGSADSNTARATISSLNAHRSSIEPPPRATISTSTSRARVGGADRPRDLGSGAVALHRRRDRRTTRSAGQRRASVVRMSRSAAARGEVTMPTARGYGGQRALALGGEPAGGLEPRLEPREALVQRADAGQPHGVDVELELAARLVDRRRGAHLDAQGRRAARSRRAAPCCRNMHAAHLRRARP